MIASPKDVEHECQLARQAINKWNALHSEDKEVVLLPIGWDTHTAPEMGDHPQKIIDKQILAETDLLVAIFLHRLGTPTLDAQSGTAHEIDSHTQSGKPAMVYFLEEKVDPSEFNREQYDKLVGFKQDMKNKGLLNECKRNHFENKFLEHLTITVNKNEYIQKKKLQIEVTNFEDFGGTDEITLTGEAKTLLMEAVNDRNGQIMKIRTMSGTSIQTKEHNLIPNQNPRTIAKWEYALDELFNNDFVEERGHKGEVFAVTHKGYEYVDTLKKETDVLQDMSSAESSESPQQDDLQFEKVSGTYISKEDGNRYCPKCLHSSSQRVPLKEQKNGWCCNVCDTFYDNPNYDRPTHARNNLGPMAM